MAATDVRPKITLACEECKNRNYITRKNRRNDPDRLDAEEVLPALRQAPRCTARPADPRRGSSRGREHGAGPGTGRRSYPPSAVYEVGREKIAEFATAVGDTDPVHHDVEAARAAGHPDVIAPADVRHRGDLGGRWSCLDDPASAIDYTRVVHGEQRFAQHRPIRAGDRAHRGRLRSTTIRELAGNDIAHLPRATSPTEDGEAVCTATSMLVGPRRDEEAPREPRRRRGRHRAARADCARSPGPTWSATPAPRATSTRSTGTSASPPRSGLPGVIAHGMFTMALAGRAVTDWAGDPAAVVEFHPLHPARGRPRRRRRRRGRAPRQGRRASWTTARSRVDLTVTRPSGKGVLGQAVAPSAVSCPAPHRRVVSAAALAARRRAPPSRTR